MANLPPLHLHLLAHPKSDVANVIAADLMRRFVEPPASGGLRIPVFFTPDRGDDLPPPLEAEGGISLDGAVHHPRHPGGQTGGTDGPSCAGNSVTPRWTPGA